MNEVINNEYEISESIKDICYRSREAWFALANSSCDQRNVILKKLAEILNREKQIIFSANAQDLEEGQASGLNSAMLDRLTLNEKRLKALIESLDQVAALPDPLGLVLDKKVRPNGLEINKISVPIGVIALIFESRPNVTIDAAALAIKSGNSMILKGGKEALHSNQALAFCLREALKECKMPEDCVFLIPFKERSATLELLKQKDKVDLVIPRGGEGLIRFVTENSLIPVIKHYKGICHIFVDRDADLNKVIPVVVNAKCSRPGVCNALETLLVDEAIAHLILPRLLERLKREGVELRGCERTCEMDPSVKPATEEDWATEYLDKILSIRVVEGLQDAVEHIERYGSRHSEAILTENKITAARFIQNVDASAVFVNASTRFNDGFEFGLGAELGISTDKLHARGPMGLREMTTYKYVVLGSGQIRE